MSIAEQVKAARLNAALYQTDLAKAAGLCPKIVRLIEKGKRDPQLSTVARLAAALNTTFTIGEAKDV